MKEKLYSSLSDCATELVLSSGYQNPSDPYRPDFANNPDSIRMHSKWHQWDIIEHSEMMSRYLENKVPVLLKEWFGGEEGAGWSSVIGVPSTYPGVSSYALMPFGSYVAASERVS